MKKIFMAAAAAAAFSLGATAEAGVLNIDGTYGVIPEDSQPTTPNNNVLLALGLPHPLGGYFESTVTLTDIHAGDKILVEYFGAEATYSNSFNMGGNSVGNGGVTEYAPDVNTPLDSFVVDAASVTDGSGLVAFNFRTIGGGADVTVENGANPANVEQNFHASFGPGHEADQSGHVLWLFFDDNGQTGDNHDDLAVRISIVPLPAAALSFLTALGGLGAVGARRRRKAS